MKKLFINNRQGQKVAVLVEETKQPAGLVLVMHGLGGNKNQPHIRTFAEAFKEKWFNVVSFDTTNTYGESDGDYADATVTNYYADLEDVINWSKAQDFYQEPFWLCGHSLGGICAALHAEDYPEQVKGLAPISTVVSGKLSMEADNYNSIAEEWKKTGWRITKSTSTPGLIKKLKWSHMEDRLKYDLLPQAYRLIMPVLMIVGEQDNSTPPRHQKILFDALPGKKELHIIKNAPHTFIAAGHLAEIKSILGKWIDSVL